MVSKQQTIYTAPKLTNEPGRITAPEPVRSTTGYRQVSFQAYIITGYHITLHSSHTRSKFDDIKSTNYN